MLSSLWYKLRGRPAPMLILVTVYGNKEIVRVGSIPQDRYLRIRNDLCLELAKFYLAGK